MSDNQLSDNLRFIRKRARLTQVAFSDLLNISRQAYSNYERGIRTPDFGVLKKICNMYHLTLDQLVYSDIPTLDALIDSHLSTTYTQKISEDSSKSYLTTKNKKTENSIYLSEEEQELIMQFRSASFETRQILIGFLANSNADKQ